jgi:NADH:ubiquinone oxidoreductase subunit 6 (subunit J)
MTSWQIFILVSEVVGLFLSVVVLGLRAAHVYREGKPWWRVSLTAVPAVLLVALTCYLVYAGLHPDVG